MACPAVCTTKALTAVSCVPPSPSWTSTRSATSRPGTGSKEETLEMAETVRSRIDHLIAELLAARRSVLFG